MSKRQFEKRITELVTLHLNKTNELDEQIDKYIPSKKFEKLSVDFVINSINIMLNEHSDFLVISFLVPNKSEVDAIGIYSSFHVDIDELDDLIPAFNNHLESIEKENHDIILFHYAVYNDKRQNRVIFKPSSLPEFYPISYKKNVT